MFIIIKKKKKIKVTRLLSNYIFSKQNLTLPL